MACAELTLEARTDTPFPDDTPRFSLRYPDATTAPATAITATTAFY